MVLFFLSVDPNVFTEPLLSPSFHPQSSLSDSRSLPGGRPRYRRRCDLIIDLGSYRSTGAGRWDEKAGLRRKKFETRRGWVGKLLKTKKQRVVRPERFELPTLWFEARCSIQLSYGRVQD